jgi:uncharacterized membrane protein YgcG
MKWIFLQQSGTMETSDASSSAASDAASRNALHVQINALKQQRRMRRPSFIKSNQEKGPTSTSLVALLPNERFVWRLKVQTSTQYTKPLLHFLEPVPGTLYLTNFRILFMPKKHSHVLRQKNECPNFFKVPLPVVFKISSVSNKDDDSKVCLFHLKDYRVLAFVVLRSETLAGRFEVFQLLAGRYAFPTFPTKIAMRRNYIVSPRPYAFFIAAEPDEDRWFYDAVQEYTRLGMVKGGQHEQSWRTSRANINYELCSTYPRILIVPRSQTDQQLTEAAQFRSRQRLPVVCFVHPKTGAPLLRSSQPYVGLRGKRSEADELLMRDSRVGLIIDCRPKKSAMANMAAGKGYENVTQHYPQCQLCFCDIENIHSVRKAHHNLIEMFEDTLSSKDSSGGGGSSGSSGGGGGSSSSENTSWMSSKWFKLLRLCLVSANQIAQKLSESGTANGVLVHCSDGWDRTAQVCSLAEMFIDPYYRTLEGFAVLVEKEWLSFGHQFHRRCGHGGRNHTDDQRSPIFVQWLDCVWQLTHQYPKSFEFNDHFLSIVCDALYSCRFGTFLYDCERQRTQTDVWTQTSSVWDFIVEQGRKVKNPNYERNECCLKPRTRVVNLNVWPYHYRWSQGMKPFESVKDDDKNRVEQIDELSREVTFYRDQVLLLQQQLSAKEQNNN